MVYAQQYPGAVPQGPQYPANAFNSQGHYGVPPAAAPVAPSQFTFIEPTFSGAGDGIPNPAPRHYVGRVVAITPHSIDENAQGVNAKPGDPPRPSMTCDVIVLGDGVIQYGEDYQDRSSPYTMQAQLPCEFTNVLISNVNIVNEGRKNLGRGVMLGRIVWGTAKGDNNRPLNFVRLGSDLDTHKHEADAARAMAQQYFAARMAGTITNPVPQPINGGPKPKANGNGAPVAPQVGQWNVQPPPSAVPQVQYAPPQPVAPPAPAPVAQSLPPAPPGWPEAAWANVVGQMGAQAAVAQFGGPAQQQQPVATAAGY
jgi:hypothetical protein